MLIFPPVNKFGRAHFVKASLSTYVSKCVVMIMIKFYNLNDANKINKNKQDKTKNKIPRLLLKERLGRSTSEH